MGIRVGAGRRPQRPGWQEEAEGLSQEGTFIFRDERRGPGDGSRWHLERRQGRARNFVGTRLGSRGDATRVGDR